MKVKSKAAHHSDPTHEIIIRLKYKSKESNLYLMQDSQRKTEYWVFWHKIEIGRIDTELFNSYIEEK